jgi:hypothetical protein
MSEYWKSACRLSSLLIAKMHKANKASVVNAKFWKERKTGMVRRG